MIKQLRWVTAYFAAEIIGSGIARHIARDLLDFKPINSYTEQECLEFLATCDEPHLNHLLDECTSFNDEQKREVRQRIAAERKQLDL